MPKINEKNNINLKKFLSELSILCMKNKVIIVENINKFSDQVDNEIFNVAGANIIKIGIGLLN